MYTLQELCLDCTGANASCFEVCEFEGMYTDNMLAAWFRQGHCFYTWTRMVFIFNIKIFLKSFCFGLQIFKLVIFFT